MPYEWLVIALPVAFLLGWAAARMDIGHIKKSAAELPRAYLRGLRELLNGNEEQSLEAFSEIASHETLPTDLQFTVGELSRRRGDYRRALKTHQRLQTNEKLPEETRNRALWEMAQDCAAMGFLDAAEQYALMLGEVADYKERVFDFLLDNYQKRRRHQKALTLIKEADAGARQMHQKTAAQLCCQLAQNSDGGTDGADGASSATAFLEDALSINPMCAHARLLLAAAALNAAPPQAQAALQHYDAIATDTPQYLWLAAEGLLRAHALGGNAGRGREVLCRWLRDFPSTMLYKTAIALLEAERADSEGAEKQAIDDCLAQVASEFVLTSESLEAVVHFIEQRQGNDNGNGERQQWLAVKKILLASCGKAFVCAECSYEMNRFTWQCPCCLSWESFTQQ